MGALKNKDYYDGSVSRTDSQDRVEIRFASLFLTLFRAEQDDFQEFMQVPECWGRFDLYEPDCTS